MAVLIAKIGPIFVSRTLPTRRILFQRSLQRPQACSLNYGRDRIATLFPDGRARTMQEWAGPRGNAVYYGRDPAKTLIRLWTGPHFNAV